MFKFNNNVSIVTFEHVNADWVYDLIKTDSKSTIKRLH